MKNISRSRIITDQGLVCNIRQPPRTVATKFNRRGLRSMDTRAIVNMFLLLLLGQHPENTRLEACLAGDHAAEEGRKRCVRRFIFGVGLLFSP